MKDEQKNTKTEENGRKRSLPFCSTHPAAHGLLRLAQHDSHRGCARYYIQAVLGIELGLCDCVPALAWVGGILD